MAKDKHIIRLEHIGIAVRDNESSNRLFEALLGKPPYKEEYVESENVHTSFFRAERSKIELLSSEDPDNVINRFIQKRGEGIHHLAFLVKDIEESIKTLKLKGFEFINEQPKKGADDKLICFIHPKSSNGVLIELCQNVESK